MSSDDLKDKPLKPKKTQKEIFNLGMKNFNFFNILMLFWLGLMVFQYFSSQNQTSVDYSEFLNRLNNDEVKEVILSEKGERLKAVLRLNL